MKEGGWNVFIHKRVVKSYKEMPKKIQAVFNTLRRELALKGPFLYDWPNYSKLASQNHHCHMQNGKPTYSACWRVVDKTLKEIEVYYAGSRENAPYK